MVEDILRSLERGPKVVERVLRVFPHDRIDDRVEVNRFTAREVVAHLADLEATVLDRIRQAHLKPGSQVDSYYDPDAQASRHRFEDKEVFHEAEVYESRRGMTLDYLRSLSAPDFEKTFQFPDGVSMSIADYCTHIVLHDLEHIEQLSCYLATEAATIG